MYAFQYSKTSVVNVFNIMDKLKFALFSIVILGLLGLLGYWSVRTLQTGSENAIKQKVKQLEKENEDFKKEVAKLTSELGVLQSQLPAPAPVTTKEPETVIYKYQDLINELQKMVGNNVSLKEKSRGSNVGTVQKFLNIYNETNSKVDNDYGAGTAKLVSDFQKDSELSADGQAGKTTFNAMIEWLKEQ